MPIFAAGNVRTGGGIAKLRDAQSGALPSMPLLVDHDDAGCEFAYSGKDDGSRNAAGKHGWSVVSMQTDWKTVFAPGD